jgi:hypothetical protein
LARGDVDRNDRKRADEILIRSDIAPPTPTDDQKLGIERRRQQAPFGGRIGMSNASAEGAARADRKMPDTPRNPRQKRAEHTTGNRRLETSVPGKRAHTQLVPVLTHIIEGSDAIDVDPAGGAGERKFIAGTRLCPPARIFSSSPCVARSSSASSTVRGAKYLNETGFISDGGPGNTCHSRQTTFRQIKLQARGDRAREAAKDVDRKLRTRPVSSSSISPEPTLIHARPIPGRMNRRATTAKRVEDDIAFVRRRR